MVVPWKNLVFLSPNCNHLVLDFWYQRISSWKRTCSYSCHNIFCLASSPSEGLVEKDEPPPPIGRSDFFPLEDVPKDIFIPLTELLVDLRNLLTLGRSSLPRLSHHVGEVVMSEPRSQKTERPSSTVGRTLLHQLDQDSSMIRFKERQVENYSFLEF